MISPAYQLLCLKGYSRLDILNIYTVKEEYVFFSRPALYNRKAVREKRLVSKPKTRWNEAVEDWKKMLSIRN
jgi:hypothetical protein